MKKTFRRGIAVFAALVFVLATAALTVACSPREEEKPETVTVTYAYTLPTGATEADVTGALPAATSVTKGSAIKVDAGTLAIKGYKLTGFTDGGGSSYKAGDSITVTADVTLTAVFERGYKLGNGYIWPENGKVKLTYGGSDYTVDYDFTVGFGDFASTVGRYRLVLNDDYTATVYTFATEVGEYYEYSASDGSMVGHILYLEDDGTCSITLNTVEGTWAEGTYEEIAEAPGEYQFTVGTTFTSTISDFRFKLATVLRSTEDGDFVFDTYLVYDADSVGTYLATDGSGATLTLDGYGYATYTADGKVEKDAVSFTTYEDVDDNDYIVMGERVFRTIVNGEDKQFEEVGAEIGVYRTFDMFDEYGPTTGTEKIVVDGAGKYKLYYDYSSSGSAKNFGASGEYTALASDEVRLDTIAYEDGAEEKLAAYEVGTRIKFAKITYGGVSTIAYAFPYYSELEAEYTGADGSTLTLDGYGLGEYKKDGELIFGGLVGRSENVVYLYDRVNGYVDDTPVKARYFRIDGTTFEEVGSEIGTYFMYDTLVGLDTMHAIYLDGKGTATRYTYYGSNPSAGETGAYVKDEDNETIEISFDSGKLVIGLLTKDFEIDYTYVTFNLYIVHHDDWAGTYTNGNYTLWLDASGLNGKYDSYGVGEEYADEGTFFVSGDLVLFYAYRDEYKFILNRQDNTFTEADEACGAFFTYNVLSGVPSRNELLVVTSDTTAQLVTADSTIEGTITEDEDNEYTFTPTEGGSAFKYKTYKTAGVEVFVRYDETLTGTFENPNATGYEPEEITLDGYGRVGVPGSYGLLSYYPAEIMGSEKTIVKYTDDYYDTYCLSLDWTTHKFTVLDGKYGYFWFYDGETVSGYVDRLFIDDKGNAELADYDEATGDYVVKATGTYESGSAGMYTFTPSDGSVEAFGFMLVEAAGKNAYKKVDAGEVPEYVGTYTANSRFGRPEQEILEIRPDGTAKYTYYTESGYLSEFEGECTVEGNFVTLKVHTSSGALMYTYTMTIDISARTFTDVHQD